MIEAKDFFDLLHAHGTDFFTGVPDSLLKNICAYITDSVPAQRHIISANEGNSVGLATGYHLATGKYPLVYMQNSGLGNTVNPLLSLADKDVYSIPLILMIGWRGEPGVKDEPQHITQGRLTLELLQTMEIPYEVLSDDLDEVKKQLVTCYSHLKEHKSPFALVIKKDTFAPYSLKAKFEQQAELTREQALEIVLGQMQSDDIVVSTTGMTSREVYELREKMGMGHERDFLTVGSMGHASQIALGIALEKNDRRVFCLDGDGAAIMHMGALSTVGALKPTNYVHIVFNNGAHDSVGGQPTVGASIDFLAIAKASGYPHTVRLCGASDIVAVMQGLDAGAGPWFIEIPVLKGARKDLGRPKSTPKDNKALFMSFVQGGKE
ncbi:MAG TPA: phosphonopyruvate decarboxylase [Myxococcota bacterium]|nr:phosphonopyruvate decarboxylase [Myxococcota bacterium]HON24684.1 phosphonopyruvate decarboxylase [Myxococcota bacterium]HOS62151.1 phosphonopyruvate decarboxylase [Myxococcota bacterium]HPC91850.1 phosphonopyruvate decarboxylase [Myxococcota bacterium]HPL24605.1 phosphonopyruvate decarboxylase [Myxococcota bacterium]